MNDSIIFYDGNCGLCHGFVRFVLARDAAGVFTFAPLQGQAAHGILAKFDRRAADLDAVFLWQSGAQSRGQLFEGPAAVFGVLRRLGKLWAVLAALGASLPAPLARLIYRGVARHRYRIFGQKSGCPLPDPTQRHRFLP